MHAALHAEPAVGPGDQAGVRAVPGTDGWLRVEGRVHHPSAITVHSSAGDQVIEAEPRVGNGYGYQVAEGARCLGAGLLESPHVPLDDTIGVLEVLDDARRQLGVRYPAVEVV